MMMMLVISRTTYSSRLDDDELTGLITVLNGTAFKIASLSRWRGSDLAIDQCGIPEAAHGLGSTTYGRFLALVQSGRGHRGIRNPPPDPLRGTCLQSNTQMLKFNGRVRVRRNGVRGVQARGGVAAQRGQLHETGIAPRIVGAKGEGVPALCLDFHDGAAT